MADSMIKPAVQDTSEFDRALAADNLAGFWTARVPVHQPEPAFLWKWQPVQAGLMRARDEIGIEFAERRVIKLVNPNLASKAASRTIQFNFSIVNPGEIARAHRHSIAAIRFIVQGSGAYTTVEGERFAMEPGDLILTPSWTWHDHFNGGAEPMIWLDGLDGPLTQALNVAFFDGQASESQAVPRGVGQHTGAALHYPWTQAHAALQAIGERDQDPFDGALLRYVNPAHGGDTLPTLSCALQRLRPGLRTQRHRHTSTALYHVVVGGGRTIVGDQVLEWARGDTFVVPLWQWHRHENPFGEEAILFMMDDSPAMRALCLYREEGTCES